MTGRSAGAKELTARSWNTDRTSSAFRFICTGGTRLILGRAVRCRRCKRSGSYGKEGPNWSDRHGWDCERRASTRLLAHPGRVRNICDVRYRADGAEEDIREVPGREAPV